MPSFWRARTVPPAPEYYYAVGEGFYKPVAYLEELYHHMKRGMSRTMSYKCSDSSLYAEMTLYANDPGSREFDVGWRIFVRDSKRVFPGGQEIEGFSDLVSFLWHLFYDWEKLEFVIGVRITPLAFYTCSVYGN